MDRERVERFLETTSKQLGPLGRDIERIMREVGAQSLEDDEDDE
jgi:hypothetical protein